MNEARFFDSVLPALAFFGIFVVPIVAISWHRAVERAASRRERQRG